MGGGSLFSEGRYFRKFIYGSFTHASVQFAAPCPTGATRTDSDDDEVFNLFTSAVRSP